MAFVSTGRRSGFSSTNSQLTKLATDFSLFMERIVLSYRQQKTFNTLNALEAGQLADIGLTKSDVHGLVELGHDQAIWRLNTARKRASKL